MNTGETNEVEADKDGDGTIDYEGEQGWALEACWLAGWDADLSLLSEFVAMTTGESFKPVQ